MTSDIRYFKKSLTNNNGKMRLLGNVNAPYVNVKTI